jgi:hypothetical protein
MAYKYGIPDFRHAGESRHPRIGLTADAFSKTGFRLAQETAPAFPVLPPSMAVAPE